MVGGSDHEAVLRRTARYADAWLPYAMPAGRLGAAAVRLRELADEHGRTPPRVHIGLHAVLGDRPADRAAAARMRERLGAFYGLPADEMARSSLAGRPDQVAEQLAEFAAAGLDEVWLALDGEDVERQIELAGEVRRLVPTPGTVVVI
jgi:alkanesulfonate monooxygenase SsuD/methylene tetrahydromethanopterin reductase-like flavin-dependent oxidoreductase (luciferase family)